MANVEVIKNRIAELEENQVKIKEVKGIIKGELENDKEYQDLLLERKQLDQKIKMRKEEILKNFGDAQSELTKSTEKISDLKEILSVELVGFAFKNQTQDVRDNDGNIHHIKINAKVVKTNQPNLFEGAE